MSALPVDRHKETTCRRDNATVVAHDEGEEGGRGWAATVSGEGIAQPRSDLFRTKTATRKWPRQIAEWNGPNERNVHELRSDSLARQFSARVA